MRQSTVAMALILGALIVMFPRSGGVQAALTKPQPPAAFDDSFSVPEDTAATVSLPGVLGNDRSRAESGLSAILVSTTAHGVLTLRTNGALSYTPARDFHGIDVFAYSATDGTRVSEPAIVAITVLPVNDPPVAVDDRATFSRLVPVKLDLAANDFDVDGVVVPSSVTIVSSPQQGRVTVGSGGQIIYTPGKDFEGKDSFTYVIWDELGARSSPGTVYLERREKRLEKRVSR